MTDVSWFLALLYFKKQHHTPSSLAKKDQGSSLLVDFVIFCPKHQRELTKKSLKLEYAWVFPHFLSKTLNMSDAWWFFTLLHFKSKHHTASKTNVWPGSSPSVTIPSVEPPPLNKSSFPIHFGYYPSFMCNQWYPLHQCRIP